MFNPPNLRKTCMDYITHKRECQYPSQEKPRRIKIGGVSSKVRKWHPGLGMASLVLRASFYSIFLGSGPLSFVHQHLLAKLIVLRFRSYFQSEEAFGKASTILDLYMISIRVNTTYLTRRFVASLFCKKFSQPDLISIAYT